MKLFKLYLSKQCGSHCINRTYFKGTIYAFDLRVEFKILGCQKEYL